jgi:hypothetical protein
MRSAFNRRAKTIVVGDIVALHEGAVARYPQRAMDRPVGIELPRTVGVDIATEILVLFRHRRDAVVGGRGQARSIGEHAAHLIGAPLGQIAILRLQRGQHRRVQMRRQRQIAIGAELQIIGQVDLDAVGLVDLDVGQQQARTAAACRSIRRGGRKPAAPRIVWPNRRKRAWPIADAMLVLIYASRGAR